MGSQVLLFKLCAQFVGLRSLTLSVPTEVRKRSRSEEHTSELQSHLNLVCRLLLEKKKKQHANRLNACGVFRSPLAIQTRFFAPVQICFTMMLTAGTGDPQCIASSLMCHTLKRNSD